MNICSVQIPASDQRISPDLGVMLLDYDTGKTFIYSFSAHLIEHNISQLCSSDDHTPEVSFKISGETNHDLLPRIARMQKYLSMKREGDASIYNSDDKFMTDLTQLRVNFKSGNSIDYRPSLMSFVKIDKLRLQLVKPSKKILVILSKVNSIDVICRVCVAWKQRAGEIIKSVTNLDENIILSYLWPDKVSEDSVVKRYCESHPEFAILPSGRRLYEAHPELDLSDFSSSESDSEPKFLELSDTSDSESDGESEYIVKSKVIKELRKVRDYASRLAGAYGNEGVVKIDKRLEKAYAPFKVKRRKVTE